MAEQMLRVQKGDKVEDVYEPMRNKDFSKMPVIDGDRYLGLMTRGAC